MPQIRKNPFFFANTIPFLLGIILLISIFIFSSLTFAEPFNKEQSPTGKLDHGAYTKWLENALETPPVSEQEKLKKNKIVVKQSRSLATESGEQVVWIIDNKLGIGIQTPQEILDIRSTDQASLKISSNSEKAQLQLENTEISLQDAQFFLRVGNKKIIITDEGINIEGEITIQGKNVVLAKQTCAENERIVGTDSNGIIICAEKTSSIPECNVNSITLSAPIRAIERCQLAIGTKGKPLQKEDIIQTGSCILNFGNTQTLQQNCKFDTTTSISTPDNS